MQSALDQFDDAACPVCETAWKPEEFKRVVNGKLEYLKEVTAKREALERKLVPIAEDLEALASTIGFVAQYAAKLPKPIQSPDLGAYATALKTDGKQLRRLLPLDETIKAIDNIVEPAEEIRKKFDEIEQAFKVLPEPTQQDAARDFLTVGQEKIEASRAARRTLMAAKKKAEKARTVADLYNKTTTEELEKIYVDVQTIFGGFYRAINRDDESRFDAKLTPSEGKLGFDVDFYGRGHFPPGAYHSEGHQDSMGLCLYLALMSHLQGKEFTFSVLDDVLMSVDAGHRREVCELLKREFPNTQFVLTTHDDIWRRHMGTTGLIGPKASVHFRTWDVDVGPTEWDDRNVWDEINDSLNKNDVRGAASLLRHSLEHFSKEVCDGLKAKVPYRGDAQYTLGELLPPAVGKIKKLLNEGQKAARSWDNEEIVAIIEEQEVKLTESIVKCFGNQWQVNVSVHYNEWAILHKNDFAPVVEAFKEFCAQLRCDKCEGLFYVERRGNDDTALRCRCSKTNFNLLKKRKNQKAA